MGTGSVDPEPVASAGLRPTIRLAGLDGAGELERVYREEATRIRALAARLGDVSLAEELVQDAFLEAQPRFWPGRYCDPSERQAARFVAVIAG